MPDIHVCSVFVMNAHNDVLCVLQEYQKIGGDAWTLPGGGVDEGETPEQAARREVSEETGLRVTGDAVPVYRVQCVYERTTIHVHGFLFTAFEGDITITEADIRQAAFMPIAQAREHMRVIDDEARLDPIFYVLDHVHATGACDLFECTYHVTEDGAIVHREAGLSGQAQEPIL